ncbi:hypothetical protein E3N88_24184 [Mikania micrantha]|uniref:Uncharacterized protein n=1 Tax=Mikania micrantha TaxID=192012 RepID=A0A5N6NH59_9ASTR|nr:hypothetical protein E3N88_24184 [Mikania micrantha]
MINGTTEALKVAGFIHGVRDKHLIRKLPGVNGTPEDMNALMTIAKAYVQQEKSVTASAEWEHRKNERKMANVPVQSSYAGRKSSVEANMKSPPFRSETGRFAPYTPREVSIVARKKEEKQETYPALTKTPGEIWRTKGLKWEQPRPLRDNPARDKSRHCDYHRVHGEKLSREEEKAEGKTVHEIFAIKTQAGNTNSIPKRRGDILEAWMCAPLLMPASDGCYSTSSLNITAMVGKYKMHRIFIDTGSSSDILYEHAFRKMSWEDQQLMERVDYPVMGFSGEMVKPMGKINLPLIIGEGKKQRKSGAWPIGGVGIHSVGHDGLPHPRRANVYKGRRTMCHSRKMGTHYAQRGAVNGGRKVDSQP